jgi:diadenosine tetraphosphatase ApaH/serine/threonine PP2A family protein phosphatase
LVYAVGDIHGRADLLAALLHQIEADAQAAEAKTRTLVFLGDYVDRGPNVRGVIETLLAGLPQGFETHFLKGNHEALLLDFLRDPATLEAWFLNDGDTTMASYGVDTDALYRARARPAEWRDAFAAALPDAHLRFFRGLELSVSRGDYLFVHAGIRPGVPLAAQTESDLVWIRRPFLDWNEPFEKCVVHGHTPGHELVTRANRICVDTGACFTGRLTAVRLEGANRSFLQT